MPPHLTSFSTVARLIVIHSGSNLKLNRLGFCLLEHKPVELLFDTLVSQCVKLVNPKCPYEVVGLLFLLSLDVDIIYVDFRYHPLTQFFLAAEALLGLSADVGQA